MNRRRFTRLILPCIALAPAGCDSPTSSRVFVDSFSLGTGRRGIDLTGTTTVFKGPYVTIYWRVESKDKLNSADVEFSLDRSTGGGFENIYKALFRLTEPDDHVVISSYYHTFGLGKFRGSGILPSSGKIFGPVEFNVVEEP